MASDGLSAVKRVDDKTGILLRLLTGGVGSDDANLRTLMIPIQMGIQFVV